MHKLINFKYFDDKSSTLVALENQANSPFDIKRVFYIFNVPNGVERGNHANKNSKFLFIALSGSCKIMLDNSFTQTEFTLKDPKQGLYLDKMIWKKMYDFSPDCVLLVLSDCYYDKNEYIDNYDEYCKIMYGGGGL
ncbi:FdtA/QdtA family cupin domain-containing protein [Campylobacter sp. CX2-8023-23]|uniref:FdtA/QdtA family cupin domain-containing protein n=1 Tax=Campylobacter porcelli TaxID=1660073 RepID=A0ABU7M747_9BACT|nr:FdtA/QdtA family cupin domain-containing protein [Campylobacter sp. CX2-8023-23]MEE3745265.1 FdtA/QdtA family cupin domain-containing protein [Campylobacter sp. CX2-4855-23]